MAANQENTIYPCPFSKNYGIPADQAWALLKVFFIYRFIVSSLFIILFYSHLVPSVLGKYNASLFAYLSYGYWIFSMLSGVSLIARIFKYTTQAQVAIFTEIIFITLLMYCSGGIDSGIGMLLAIPIAAGGLLIGGRCAIVFAALASISILTEEIYAIQAHSFSTSTLTNAGMLGASFFAIAYLSYVLVKRTEQSEQLVSKHQQTISNLEELSQYIIQHLTSGIIISNDEQQIKMCNQSVLNIIGSPEDTHKFQQLSDISPQLTKAFHLWQGDKAHDFAIIMLPNSNKVHIRFSLLKTHQATFHMIIIEDISLYNQQIQQSVLASLGQLTASIAHEVRNPLGAISHAAQLLSESPALPSQDQRLTEIIQNHCQRVNKIIEDVLQLSRRQLSHQEKIEMNAWVKVFIHQYMMDTNCDPDSFEINSKDENLWTYMDDGHLKQILTNLCSNALKYSNSSDKITLELSLVNNAPCLKILDHGDKIDAKTANDLFKPFHTTSTSGTGLGLYISKELAELNLAKLSYAITDDDKNSFILSLPSAENPQIKI